VGGTFANSLYHGKVGKILLRGIEVEDQERSTKSREEGVTSGYRLAAELSLPL